MKSFLVIEEHLPSYNYAKHLISLRYGESHVFRATDAQDALRKINKIKFSAILADFIMQSMDGVEFHEKLKCEFPLQANNLGFIASSDFSYQLKYLERESVPFLLKPFKQDQFNEFLDGILMNERDSQFALQREHQRKKVFGRCSLKASVAGIVSRITGEITDISFGGFGFKSYNYIPPARFHAKVISMPLNIFDKKAELVWAQASGDISHAGFRWA